MSFILTPKQIEAQAVMAGPATHILLEGGGRSGKTSLIVRNIGLRAIKAPGSEHAILRFRFNHCKASIVLGTFPKVMKAAFPDVHYRIDKQDWYAEIASGMMSSRIWFGGIDDKERTEKILGNEYATIFLNEISQIPFASRETVITRLAQLVMQNIKGVDGKTTQAPLKPRAYYDQNPGRKSHWSYKMFHELIDPDSKRPLLDPSDFAYFKINPRDNLEHITPEYLKILQSLSAAKRKRFLDGEYSDDEAGLLFSDIDIEKWRILDDELPAMVRIVIGVDPSGAGDKTDPTENHEIGIVAGGLGTDGNAYLLEDVSVQAGPATWGKVTGTAYERHEANVVVGEGNFGGAMVEHVIQTARPRTPYKMVTASRGKMVRAEPFSALYEQGRVRHAGIFQKLEDELCNFSTRGYLGEGSPNRADAWIWVLAELFAGIVEPKRAPPKQGVVRRGAGQTFMAD